MASQLNDPSSRSAARAGGRQGIDEPVEFRRYLDALRRGRWLILILALSGALAAYGLSTLAPNRYKSTATIVKRVPTGPTDTVNVDSITRELNTIVKLLVTTDVLDRAAKRIGGGATARSLSKDVESKVDPDANLISITATRDSPKGAARTANAVARTFVAVQAAVTRQQYALARRGLLDQLARIRSSDPGAAQQEQAIRQRLSDIGVSLAAAGTDLRVAQLAGVPEHRTSPRPLRNAVIALFLGLFIGVLITLGRDQLVPRVSDGRELGRLVDLPVLASVPYVRRRFRRQPALSPAEYESYQTLGASLRFSLPAEEGPHVIVVTSGLHAEGKTTVTARLGGALARAGHRTLIVSADLRWPTLHAVMGVDEQPGLTELIGEIGAARTAPKRSRLVESAIVSLERGQRRGDLDMLPSGRKPTDPASELGSDGFGLVTDQLRASNYTYILIDAPPLLGIADTRTLALHASSILFVARLDRVTLETVIDSRDVLDRLDAPAIGCVIIGARSEASPYYMGLRTPAVEDD
jgi:Mrp family chromosome partitioning ATPase/capsular polysaccharide biosynthesis protein